MVEHLKSTDKRHAFHSGAVYTWKCTKCGDEITNSDSTSPFCERCQTYMKAHDKISSDKCDEIRNRVFTEIPENMKPKRKDIDLWDEGMIKKRIRATVRPVSGKEKLVIFGRMNKKAWQEKIVKIGKGWYRLSDIGFALKEVM